MAHGGGGTVRDLEELATERRDCTAPEVAPRYPPMGCRRPVPCSRRPLRSQCSNGGCGAWRTVRGHPVLGRLRCSIGAPPASAGTAPAAAPCEHCPYESLPPLDSSRSAGAFQRLGDAGGPVPEQVTKLNGVAGDLAARGLTLPQDFVTFRTGAHVRAYIRLARRRGGCRPQSVRDRGIPASSARRRASWWWPRRRAVPGRCGTGTVDGAAGIPRAPRRIPGGSPALPAALFGEPASAQSRFAPSGFSPAGRDVRRSSLEAAKEQVV